MPLLLNKDKNKLDKELVTLFLLMLGYKNSKDFKKLTVMYKNNRNYIKDSVGKIYLKYIRDNKLVITQREINKELKQLDTKLIKVGIDLKNQENIILGTLLYKTYEDTYNKSINIVSKYKSVDKGINLLIGMNILDIVNLKIKGKTNMMRNMDNKTIFINKVKTDIKKDLVVGKSIEVINKTIDRVFQKGGIDITDRLIDNEVSRMFNDALIDGYKEVGIERVVYNSVLDTNTCDNCASCDGDVYDIDDAPSLPIHCRCNCFYTPEI